MIAYSVLKNEARDTAGPRDRAGIAVLFSVAAVLVAVVGVTLLATAGQSLLPTIMQGTHYTPAMTIVVSSVWGFFVTRDVLDADKRRFLDVGEARPVVRRLLVAS